MKIQPSSWRIRWAVWITVLFFLSNINLLCAEDLPDLFLNSSCEQDTCHVQIDFSLIEPESIMNEFHAKLPFDRDILLIYEHISIRGKNNYTWFGRVKDEDSMVVLTFKETLMGYITIGADTYIVEPEQNIYSVTKKPSVATDPYMNDALPIEPGTVIQSIYPPDSDYMLQPEDGSVIDVLVLYTNKIMQKYGRDPRLNIQHLIDITNQAYRNSGILTELNLVHCELYGELGTNEEADIKSALLRITESTSPAAKLRDQLKADMTVLLRSYNNSGICGKAWTMTQYFAKPQFEAYAFSVVEIGGSCSELTFAHELGHNMGCEHDRANARNEGAFDYSYGYGIPGVFGTIMSYIEPKIPYFSTPKITYQGYPIGKPSTEPDSADIVSTINLTRKIVANFRARENIISIVTSDIEMSVPENGTASFQVYLSEKPAQLVIITASIQGDPNISIQAGAILEFDEINWNIPKTVTLYSAVDADARTGQAIVKLSSPGLSSIDVWVYEDDNTPINPITDKDSATVLEGQTVSFQVKLTMQPDDGETVTVTATVLEGSELDFQIQAGSTLSFGSANWNIYQEITFYLQKDEDDVEDLATIRLTSDKGNSIDIVLNGMESQSPETTLVLSLDHVKSVPVSVVPDAIIPVPLRLENDGQVPIEGMDITIVFNPSVVEPYIPSLTGGELQNLTYSLYSNKNTPGQIRIELFSGSDNLFSGSGILCYLRFKGIGSIGSKTDLTFTRADINEKPVQIINGSLELIAQAYSIAGNINYYHEETSVRNVYVTLDGNTDYTIIGSEQGSYEFSGIAQGNYSVTPSKTDDTGGISATDASRIARKNLNGLSFNCYQHIAADVSMNGDISSTDVSKVARYAVGIIDKINDTGQEWVFVPADYSCPDGQPLSYPTSYNYSLLNSNKSNQNFIAIRLGDVTGNWKPSAPIVRRQPESVESIAVNPGPFSVAIMLDNDITIEGIDITIEFDTRKLIVTDVILTGGTLDNGAYQLEKSIIPETGKMKIAMYAIGTPITESGDIAFIYFDTTENATRSDDTDTVSIFFERFEINETAYEGKFRVQDSITRALKVQVIETNSTIPEFADAIRILKFLTGINPEAVSMAMDYNQDTRINLSDVIIIMQRVSGIL